MLESESFRDTTRACPVESGPVEAYFLEEFHVLL